MDYDEKLKAAEEKLKKAEATVKRLKALNDKKTRAEETRIKILTGAACLNHMAKLTNDETKKYFHLMLKQNLNDKDFEYLNSKIEGWRTREIGDEK